MRVDFNKIPISGAEIDYMRKAIDSGHLQGGGEFMKICEDSIRKTSGSHCALLTTSCSSALDMAALLLNIKEGDEVIVPTFTFVSTVNAFVLRGAKPVFADVRPDTLNIDESKIEELITSKTRAIAPVHYAGVSCEMDAICGIAHRRGIAVVEDAAQGFMSYYKGRHLGSIGTLGALSFHSTKNVIAGEGGAILVNDPSMEERANFIREKGTNRIQFVRGKIDKYTWVDYGSSFIPSELLAAFLAAQLEKAEDFTRARVEAWNYYAKNLSELEREGKIFLCKLPDGCVQNGHIYFISTDTPQRASQLAEFLKAREVFVNSHYAPLHMCPMAEKLGCSGRPLPVAEKMAKTMLRLPIYSAISRDQQDWVCESIRDFFKA